MAGLIGGKHSAATTPLTLSQLLLMQCLKLLLSFRLFAPRLSGLRWYVIIASAGCATWLDLLHDVMLMLDSQVALQQAACVTQLQLASLSSSIWQPVTVSHLSDTTTAAADFVEMMLGT